MSLIALDRVSLCYRLARERVPSLKEYAIHFLRGSLSYQDLWAMREVSFEVDRGEAVGIVGRNGAGKSTLLKVISGILEPTEGALRVDGRVAPLLELGTGFDFELTGVENIYLNALLLGHSRREVAERIEEIVAFSELEEFVRSPLRNYSSGMVARLGFAIATAWPIEILILDEVLGVGDASFQAKCHRRLGEILAAGTTVLMVSHSPEALRQRCRRCLWLDQGRLLADGPIAEVLDAYEGRSPGMPATAPATAGNGGD